MDFKSLISNVFLKQNDTRLEPANTTTKISALYVFYHYCNADLSRLDDVFDSLINKNSYYSFDIKSILKSVTADDCVDFNSYLTKEDFTRLDKDLILNKIRDIAKEVGAIIYHDDRETSSTAIKAYDDLGVKLTESSSFMIRIIAPFEIDVQEKVKWQALVSELCVSNRAVMFEIIFGDDLEEEVNDIEAPKEYVPCGSIGLMTDSICSFGDEGSFLTLISAKSIKKLFFQYSTKGLFASNLRFYITSKKIDGKIVDTIKNEPENFCYFNNGIIITCDDYDILDGRVVLYNFSIVNGGQTSNLIGRASFTEDFGVICKVIKNKYSDKNERVTFLAKVAEASNMQKPINAKDLIANRPEQRMLKIQYSEAGMFLKIKRGEKIDKSIYSEPYMNASNDEVAQMLYSYVYQAPGAAKNSKSSVIGNDKTYSLIFKTNYDSNFLKSMQLIKAAFCEWQKKVNKSEPHSSVKYGLSRHANYYLDAIIGFYLKLSINKKFYDFSSHLFSTDFNNRNFELKTNLKINDIGSFSMINLSLINQLGKTAFFDFFNFVFEYVLIPAYTKFKKAYPNYAYGQFCKSDSYYYDYVIPFARNLYFSSTHKDELKEYLNHYFNTSASVSMLPNVNNVEVAIDGLEDELKEYRSKVAADSFKQIKIYEVIKNMQIAHIVRCYPKNETDLSEKCDLSAEQISKYGKDILKIVAKYIKTGDFE